MKPRWLQLLHPMYDIVDPSGRTVVDTAARAVEGALSPEVTKQLEDLKKEGADQKALIEKLTGKFADVDEQNKSLGKMKKQVEGWLERVKSDPSAVLTELGGDPLAVGTQVLGDLDPSNRPDEPPGWFQKFADDDREWKAQREQKDQHEASQGQHYQRFGQLRQFMGQEGAAEKYPFVSMMGDAALDVLSGKMREREKADGYAPTPAQMLETENKMMDDWNASTTKMWAKNKIAAKRMFEALQEEGGYSLQGASPRLTLMNEDDGVGGGDVDSSKLKGDALIKHNMALADAATEATEAGKR